MSTNSLCLSHIPGAAHTRDYREHLRAGAHHASLEGGDTAAEREYEAARRSAHYAAEAGARGPLLDWIQRQTIDA